MANFRMVGLLFAGASILGWIGVRKYRELKALTRLTLTPSKPVFQLVRVNGGVADVQVNLILKNPTDYQVNVKRVRAEIFIYRGTEAVKLGTVQTATLANPNQDTFLVVPGSFDLKQVLEFGKQFLFEAVVPVVIRGSVNYITSGINVPVPFEFQIDAKEEFLKALA